MINQSREERKIDNIDLEENFSERFRALRYSSESELREAMEPLKQELNKSVKQALKDLKKEKSQKDKKEIEEVKSMLKILAMQYGLNRNHKQSSLEVSEMIRAIYDGSAETVEEAVPVRIDLLSDLDEIRPIQIRVDELKFTNALSSMMGLEVEISEKGSVREQFKGIVETLKDSFAEGMALAILAARPQVEIAYKSADSQVYDVSGLFGEASAKSGLVVGAIENRVRGMSEKDRIVLVSNAGNEQEILVKLEESGVKILGKQAIVLVQKGTGKLTTEWVAGELTQDKSSPIEVITDSAERWFKSGKAKILELITSSLAIDTMSLEQLTDELKNKRVLDIQA